MSQFNLRGKVAIFGISGTVTLAGSGMITSSNLLPQSAAHRQSTETVDLQTSQGDVVTRIWANEQATCELELTPYSGDGTSSLATLSASVKRIDPGSTVTLAGFDIPQFNGDWNFNGAAEVTPRARGYAAVRITLVRPAYNSAGPVALS